MALVTTVATTPLTTVLYPLWYQKKLESWKRGEIDWDGNRIISEGASDATPEQSLEKLQSNHVRKLLVYLRLDSLPSLFTFMALLSGDKSMTPTKYHQSKRELETVLEGTEPLIETPIKRPLEVHGLRMLELTERTSSVMKVSEGDDYSYRDPVVNAFRTFAQLNNVAVSGGVSVVPEDSYAETLNSQALDYHSDLLLIPWSAASNPTEDATARDTLSSGMQDTFIQKTLETATCNTAIFFNRGFGGPVQEPRTLNRTVSGLSLRSHREPVVQPIADRSHHVYLPFFGGSDDRAALRFVLQLAQNSNITATIIHFIIPLQSASKSPEVVGISRAPIGQSSSQLTISERVDTAALYSTAAADTALLHTLRDSLTEILANRVVFIDVPTTTPVLDSISHARQEVAQSPKNAGDLIVVGRGKHNTIASSEGELGTSASGAEMRKTLGIVAESIISGGVRASVLVFQAGGQNLDH
jgi:hypothetical protein